MKGDKVLSVEVLYERPKGTPKDTTPLPSIKVPDTPIPSPLTSPRPDFLEPLPVSPGSSFQKEFLDDMKKNQEAFIEWEVSQPSTWHEEIENLEWRREKYNIKAAWSAKDISEVEKIDSLIKEYNETLYNLEEVDYQSKEGMNFGGLGISYEEEGGGDSNNGEVR